jgi:hypothetical protein
MLELPLGQDLGIVPFSLVCWDLSVRPKLSENSHVLSRYKVLVTPQSDSNELISWQSPDTHLKGVGHCWSCTVRSLYLYIESEVCCGIEVEKQLTVWD